MMIMQRDVDYQVARRSAGGWRALELVGAGRVKALQTNFVIALDPLDIGKGEPCGRHRGVSFGGELLSGELVPSAVVGIGARSEFLPDHPQNAVDQITIERLRFRRLTPSFISNPKI